jgi:hypothetical protein
MEPIKHVRGKFDYLLRYKTHEDKEINKVKKLIKHRSRHLEGVNILSSEKYDALGKNEREEYILDFLRGEDGQFIIHELFVAHNGQYQGHLDLKNTKVMGILEELRINNLDIERNRVLLKFIQDIYNHANSYLKKRHQYSDSKFSAQELLSYSLFTGQLQTERDMDALEIKISQNEDTLTKHR